MFSFSLFNFKYIYYDENTEWIHIIGNFSVVSHFMFQEKRLITTYDLSLITLEVEVKIVSAKTQ